MDKLSGRNDTGLSMNGLFIVCGVIALVLAAIIPAQAVLFMLWPPPDTASGWFSLFQSSPVLGLLSFEFLFIIYGVLSVPIYIALYFTLRRTDQILSAVFIALGLAGTVLLLTARPAFEMLFLSGRYAAAAEAQKPLFLAAGESMIAVFHGSAYYVSYVLASLTGILLSIVMLKGHIFSKTIASVRILSGILDFGLFIPGIGLFISLISVLLLLIWNIMIGIRFFQLGRDNSITI